MTQPRCGFRSLRLARMVDHGRSALLTTCAVMIAAMAGNAANAQASNTNSSADDGWIAVVTADRVPLRCGANDTYYPIGHVERGAMVRVIGQWQAWAKIATEGPAFEKLFGHIKYTPELAGRFRVATDGTSGRAMGQVDVLGPNVTEKADPRHSWRPIGRLSVDQQLDIIQTDRVNGEIVHTVKLPTDAFVWVSMAQLREATDAEARTWKRRPAPTAGTDTGPGTATSRTNPAQANRDTQRSEAGQPTRTGDGQLPTVGSLTDPLPTQDSGDTAAAGDTTPPVLARDEQELPTVSGPGMDKLIHNDGTVERIDKPVPGVPLTSIKRVDSAPREELKGLETAFEALSEEPIETAEVLPLRNLYLEYASRVGEDSPRLASFARARAEQLEIWQTLQQRKRDLVVLKQKLQRAGEDVEQVRRALRGTGSYTAVGRLTASTIYDGSRLPKLLRLQDPGTGRTVAYLELDKEFDLTGMLGQLIGIMGDRAYDPALRLNLITPRRIDLLAPSSERDAAVLANGTPPPADG